MAARLRIGFEVIAAGSGLDEGSGGAEGALQGIVPELAQDPRLEELIVYVPAWYERADEWDFPKLRIVKCRVPKQRSLRVGYEHLGIPARAARDRVDVLFSTGNYRPLLYPRCNVVWLHAIQHFLLGDDIGGLRARYLEFTVPRSVKTADVTIAVTETLRRDAIKLWDLDPDRVVSVPMGPPPWVAELLSGDRDKSVEPYRLPDGSPYVMCISRLYALKNHRRLIEAYARLVGERDVPHRLVIVGGDADVTSEELKEVARAAGVGDRVLFLGRVPQKDVHGLYAGASAIVYPSLYETFGHPVLEAFATGIPLLTSSHGATAEVAGAGARLVDPEDVDDIAAGLADVLFDDELRQRLVEAGRQRARDFTWRQCSHSTVDVFEQAVARRRSVRRPLPASS
jgi:glycosyltransferase involved in cell wall biosynthesis